MNKIYRIVLPIMVQLVTSSFIKSNNSIGNNSNVPKDIPRVEEPARTFEFINRQDLLNLFNQNSRTVQFLQASDTIDNKDFNDLLNLYYEELVKHVKDVEAKKINCAENFELCKETLEGYTGGIDSQKTTMIFYEIKRKEILPYTNTQDFIDKARFLTIPKIRTIKTEDKFNSFLQYPVGLIGYLDPTGDNQFETIKELTVLGRKYSNVFFQIGNIPANAISQDQTFHDEIRTGGYGYYQTLNLPGSEKPVIRKYPYNNPDYQALTVWVEVESLPDIIEQNHENFNRIFRGSIHTHVVLFMPESESQNNQNLTNELTKASRYNREEDLFYHRAIYIVCKYGTDQEFEHAYGVHDHNQPRLFVTSTHKGDFMRYRLEETEKITEDSINSLLQGAINRSIDPIYLSEPVELMSILKGAEQESNVRKIVADSFKKEVLKSDKNQILMLCNEKERCDYFVQTFIYLSNLMKGTGVEFLFMNGDYNEVSGMKSEEFPYIKLYFKGYKSKPKDFDLPFNVENLASFMNTFIPDFKFTLTNQHKMEYTWALSNEEEKRKIAEAFLGDDKDGFYLKEFGEGYLEEFRQKYLADYVDINQPDL